MQVLGSIIQLLPIWMGGQHPKRCGQNLQKNGCPQKHCIHSHNGKAVLIKMPSLTWPSNHCNVSVKNGMSSDELLNSAVKARASLPSISCGSLTKNGWSVVGFSRLIDIGIPSLIIDEIHRLRPWSNVRLCHRETILSHTIGLWRIGPLPRTAGASNDEISLAHTKRDYAYHIMWIPKRKSRIMYEEFPIFAANWLTIFTHENAAKNELE